MWITTFCGLAKLCCWRRRQRRRAPPCRPSRRVRPAAALQHRLQADQPREPLPLSLLRSVELALSLEPSLFGTTKDARTVRRGETLAITRSCSTAACSAPARGRCPPMDVRLNCGYCFIRDINNVNDLHSAIQQDDEAAILQGGQQSRSSQIDSNSAIMAERRQRCLSIPPGYCTGTSRDGCDYCRMRDIIATRNIQHVGANMSPAELQATIQQDAFELSNQIDRVSENMLERQRRCTTTPHGSCA